MDNNEILDDNFFSELLEDDETLELLDFALLEDDSVTLLLEDDEILELLDFALLEDDSVTLLLEDGEILELLDFALLEDESFLELDDFSLLEEDSNPYESSSLGIVGVEQAAKKTAVKTARNNLKNVLFIREIYILRRAFAIFQ